MPCEILLVAYLAGRKLNSKIQDARSPHIVLVSPSEAEDPSELPPSYSECHSSSEGSEGSSSGRESDGEMWSVGSDSTRRPSAHSSTSTSSSSSSSTPTTTPSPPPPQLSSPTSNTITKRELKRLHQSWTSRNQILRSKLEGLQLRIRAGERVSDNKNGWAGRIGDYDDVARAIRESRYMMIMLGRAVEEVRKADLRKGGFRTKPETLTTTPTSLSSLPVPLPSPPKSTDFGRVIALPDGSIPDVPPDDDEEEGDGAGQRREGPDGVELPPAY